MAQALTIGVLARQAGCQVETIRYYEREGLLPKAPRSAGNYRLYDARHLERLSFIRHCRSLDMTHDEIRALLKLRDMPARNCAEVNVLLDEHIGHVSRRIAELQNLQSQLRSIRRLCSREQAVKDCRIMKKLEQNEAPVKSHRPRRTAHTGGT
jgi:Cd(II)/Pb(II)-responsive transcriptional regulator